MKTRQRFTRLLSMGVLGAALALGGCHYVKQDQMDAEMARIRQEMHTGDQTNAARIDSVSSRVDSLGQALEQMRSDFNVQIKKLQGLLAFDVPVHFDFNSAELRPSDEPVLKTFASIVKQYYPNAVVTVEGFADPAGSAAYNRRLGMKRADSVKAYLTGQGELPASQVRTVSYGEARNRQVVPGAHGPGDTGIQNRRVALVVDYSGEAPPPVAENGTSH